jgi:hypothetical protein
MYIRRCRTCNYKALKASKVWKWKPKRLVIGKSDGRFSTEFCSKDCMYVYDARVNVNDSTFSDYNWYVEKLKEIGLNKNCLDDGGLVVFQKREIHE